MRSRGRRPDDSHLWGFPLRASARDFARRFSGRTDVQIARLRRSGRARQVRSLPLRAFGGRGEQLVCSRCYCETVPSIQISTGPWLPGDRFPPVPRPRSPAYALVPLVILQPPKWPTVIRMVPFAPKKMRTPRPGSPSRSSMNLPRSEIAPEMVKHPRPGLPGPSPGPQRWMLTAACKALLELAPDVPVGRAYDAGRCRRQADLHCQHEQQPDRHHEADGAEVLDSIRGHLAHPLSASRSARLSKPMLDLVRFRSVSDPGRVLFRLRERPGEPVFLRPGARQVPLAAPVGVHDVDLLVDVAVALAHEGDPLPVGRPGGSEVARRVARQPPSARFRRRS